MPTGLARRSPENRIVDHLLIRVLVAPCGVHADEPSARRKAGRLIETVTELRQMLRSWHDFFCTLTLALFRWERGLATARNDRALSLGA